MLWSVCPQLWAALVVPNIVVVRRKDFLLHSHRFLAEGDPRYGPPYHPRGRNADPYTRPVRNLIRAGGRRRADHGRLRPRSDAQAGQGRAVADGDRLPVLHAPSLRPRRGLSLLPADSVGPEHRQGERPAGIRADADRAADAPNPGRERGRVLPRLEGAGEPPGQPDWST